MEKVPDKGRKKRWTTRVKTGCVTCRARRVKCDEAKPECKRCLAGRRECGGYALDSVVPRLPRVPSKPTRPTQYVRLAPRPAESSYSSVDEDGKPTDEGSSSIRERSSSSPDEERGIPILAHRRAPVAVDCTREDQLMMYFFRSQGSRNLGGAFDEDFWTVDLLRATVSHPIIWHSCASLAAFYWRSNANKAVINPSGTLRRLEIVGMTQYGRALHCAADLAAKPHLRADEKQVLLMANLVLTGINFLLGRATEAMVHLCKGVSLFHEWHIIEQAFDGSSADELLPMTSLTAILNRFFTQTYAYRDRSWPNIVSKGRLLLQDATSFRSLTEAYFALEEIYNRQCFAWREEMTAAARSEPSPKPDMAYKSRMQFNMWERRFADFEANNNSLDDGDEEAMWILRLRSKMLAITLALDHGLSELALDEFTTQLEDVLDLAEAIIELRSKKKEIAQAFSFSASVCEPLTMIIVKCRNSTIRRRALELLRRADLREGVYDTTEVVSLVSVVVDMEDAQLARPRDPTDLDCNCIQHIFLCNDHRIADTQASYGSDGRVATIVKLVRDVRLGKSGVVVDLPG